MFCAFLGHTGERLQDHWSSGYHFDSDPRFPPFLLYVGGNLGSLLNGDVSVMAFKHNETGIRGFLKQSDIGWLKTI